MSDLYPYGDSELEAEPTAAGAALPETSFTRRDLLKQGTAAVLGSGASVLGGRSAFAQAPAQQAPTVITGWRPATAGRKFRALVRYRTNLDVQELTLNPIHPRQIVARVEAGQACYTLVGALDTSAAATNAAIFGHGAVAIVEEVGPLVKRVQPGDRVIIAVTGQCGECFNCLRGRGANCQAGFNRPNLPVATMTDGTPVNGQLGGFAELIVAWEEMTVPIFSKYDAAALSNLSCVAMTGLGMTMLTEPPAQRGGVHRDRRPSKVMQRGDILSQHHWCQLAKVGQAAGRRHPLNEPAQRILKLIGRSPASMLTDEIEVRGNQRFVAHHRVNRQLAHRAPPIGEAQNGSRQWRLCALRRE